jgi:hypothetical protein
LDDIGYLTADSARRLACDAKVFPIVLGTNSEPLNVGQMAYSVPTHMRRALIARDGGCTFPGVRHEALLINLEVRDRQHCYVAS